MEHLGGSSKLLRAMNEAAALGHVLDRGRLTRAELRELTGLSKPTISEAFKRLTESGLVTVVGHESGRPGPNAEVYAVNPDAAYAVAVSVRYSGDTGAPAVTAAVCDLAGNLRGRIESPIDFTSADPITAVNDVVADACLAADIDRERIAHVQIAIAGSYDPRADVIHHVDVPGWARPGLVGDLGRVLGAPVGVDNDVNLAAVAERVRGAAQDVDGFALLWIGEGGLGLAIDLGGQLLRGARGGAGEIGYMPIGTPDSQPGDSSASHSSASHSRASGSRAGDSRAGHSRAGRSNSGRVDFQDLVGSHAVLELAAAHAIEEKTATLAVARAVERAVQRDETARAFISALAGRIAVGLAAVVAVLDPQLVVLGGEIGQAGGPTLGAAVGAAMGEAAPLPTTIAVTAVQDDAVLLGAVDAALASVRDRILTALRHPYS